MAKRIQTRSSKAKSYAAPSSADDVDVQLAQEGIMAGHLPNQHPNTSKSSSNGTAGSKFETTCVTGDAKKQLHMEGYAVCAKCMALLPTEDAPVPESSDKQFVPDVPQKPGAVDKSTQTHDSIDNVKKAATSNRECLIRWARDLKESAEAVSRCVEKMNPSVND